MSAAHTPGLLVHDTRGYPHADVKAAYGRSVANTWGVQGKPAKTAETYERRLKEGRANARRLVACWNACEGVDTDLLEQNPAPFSELRAERDALQKAVTDLVANSPNLLDLLKKYEINFTDEKQARAEFGDFTVDRELLRRAAIAKATGGAA